MAHADELRKEVGSQIDPPSLTYFGKVAELEQWLEGDGAKRGRLEKRWRKKYADHQKKRAARHAEAGKGGGS